MARWTCVEYSDASKIRPHLLHHLAVAPRLKDIAERYNGAMPVLQMTQAECFFDLGGKKRPGDCKFDVKLDKDRTFVCYQHQMAEVAKILRLRPEIKFSKNAKTSFCRIRAHGTPLIYLSWKDRDKILAAIDAEVDVDESAKRNAEILLAAAKSNVYAAHARVHAHLQAGDYE